MSDTPTEAAASSSNQKKHLTKAEKEERKRQAAEKRAQPPGWLDIPDEKNTSVYVSNLPLDITEEEFEELMRKVGVIMTDPRTGKPKIKLYRTSDKKVKGDGTCCYVKMESVILALDILDGWTLRTQQIKVERAHFELKGEYDPSKKRRKLTIDQKKRYFEQQKKLFEWQPEKARNYRAPHECTVILTNVFDKDEMLHNVTLALDLKEHVKETCERYGKVKKVAVYANHPDGVVGVTFDTVEEADYCIEYMKSAVFRHRQITAATWDGHTKYKIKESAEDAAVRDEQWEAFLKGEGSESEDEDHHRERPEGQLSNEQ